MEPRKAYRKLVILACIAAALLAVSVAAPVWMPNDPNETNPAAIRVSPNVEYPLGTDHLGRCVLSRILAGAKTSIFSALMLVSLTFLAGTAVGIICGYLGGIVDILLMRLADLLLALPQMIVAIAVAGVLGGGMGSALIAIGCTAWTSYARLAKSQVLTIRNEPYIQAAKMSGLTAAQVLRRHILPNCAGPLIVNMTVQLGTTLTAIAGLSFLGLGVQPPQAEWGSMISEASAYLQLAPWAVLAPGAAIVITVSAFNLLGDAARDYLDRRLR